jgi:hypothetical protein
MEKAELVKGYQIRCPRLGGEVTFAYCQREQGDLPCSRVILCWQAHFPVEEYFRERLTEEEWKACFDSPGQDKMTTLVELIEAAKKRKDPSG